MKFNELSKYSSSRSPEERCYAVYEAGLIPNYVIALAKDGKMFFKNLEIAQLANRGTRWHRCQNQSLAIFHLEQGKLPGKE